MAQFDKKLVKSLNPSHQNVDLSTYEFGKLPPQAIDLEEAVLGAVMIDNDCLDTVAEILKAETFYSDTHQKIFSAVLELYHAQKPVDILTVTEQLRFHNHLEDVGGAFYVTDLTNRVASAANVEYHCRIISQKHIQRRLISISSHIIKDSYDDSTDVFELLDKSEQALFEIGEQHLRRNSDEISDVITNELDQIEERVKLFHEGVEFTGVGSGFTELDRQTAGWQPSDLVIVAARPGMGKTAFTLALARNASVDMSKPVAFFSLEMSANQLVQRLIAMESELPIEKIRKGSLERHELHQLTTKIDSLKAANFVIDDTPGINVFELRSKIRKMKKSHEIQMVIIDYLQLMSGHTDSKSGGNREQEISHISRSLKAIAKEMNIPVIALSQLSRAVETRGGTKRPQLSDLRESGAIEQDADMVIFLYRPEYYGIDTDEEGNDCRGKAEIIISKHRNGPLGTINVRFIDKFAKFADPDPTDFAFQDPGFGPPSGGGTITRTSRMNENDPYDDGNDPPF